jgi:hypothetical protein
MAQGFKSQVLGLDLKTLEVVVKITPQEGETFQVMASPFFWGRKTLMKVCLWERGEAVETGNDILSQGMKVSIGALAKKAIKDAGLVLPEAPPSKRGAKAAAAVEAPAAPELEVVAALKAELEALKAMVA